MNIKPTMHLLMLVCLAGAAQSPSPAYGAAPIKLGVLAFPSKSQALKQWQPLTVVLKQAMPERNFEVVALTPPEFDQAITDQQLDFVLTNAGQYVLLKNGGALSAPLATLATGRDGRSLAVYGGVIFCRAAQADLNTLRDINGKTVAAVDIKSLGAYQMQAYELSRLEILLPQDFKLLTTGLPQSQVVQDVLAGRADVGFVRSGVLEGMVRKGKLDIRQLKILNRRNLPNFPFLVSTRLYPEWPFAALPHVDEKLARQVAIALFELEEKTAVTRVMGIHGFVVPADYSPVENVLRELRLPPFKAGPRFTLQDIWARYRWQTIVALLAGGVILLLGISVVLIYRRLAANHQVLLLNRQKLQVSEEKFRSLAEATSNFIWEVDQNGHFTYASSKVEALLGYKPAEVLGKTPFDFMTPEEGQRIAPVFAEHLDKHTPIVALENDNLDKDGRVVVLETSGVPFFDPKGEFAGYMGINRDVTVRKLFEQEIQTTNEQLSVLLDSLPVAVYRCAAEGDYAVEYMSQNVASFTGYTARNFMDQADLWFSHIHPADVPKVSDEIELLAEKGRHAYEYRWRKADGNYLWIRDSLRLVRSGDGTPNYLVGMWQNITEDKLAAETLRKANDDLSLFRRLLDNSTDGIEVIDSVTLRFLDVNDTSCLNLGYSREELLTMSVYDIDPKVSPDTVPMLEEQLRKSGSARFETTHRRKDGSTFPVEVNMGAITLDKPYFLSIVRDISERKQAAEALERLRQDLAMILEAAGEGICTIDVHRNHLLVNPAAARMLGYEVEEMIGRHSHSFWHSVKADSTPYPEDECPIYVSMRDGVTCHTESDLFWRKDGTGFPVEYVSSPILTDGVITGCVIVFHDITERKEAEEQIRTQQKLTTQIIETIPLRVFWKDRALHYLGCNTPFARDAGKNSPAELLGKDDSQMGWKEQAELYRADDQRVMDSDTPILSFEEPQTTPTGERIWLRTSKVPLHNEAGDVFGLLGIYDDVTEQVEDKHQLELNNAVLRAQQETSPDAILVVDENTKIVTYNQHFADLWNLPKKLLRLGGDEPLLRTVLEQMSDPEAFVAKVQHLYEHTTEKSHDELLLKDDRVIDRYSSPILGSDGKYFGRVWYFRDISERKQAEKQILILNKDLEDKVKVRTKQLLDAQDELVRTEKLALLGQVVGSVGHELRNPLGVMNNAVYFLQTVLADADETTGEYLQIIQNEIVVADRIVGDLLDSVRTKPPQSTMVSVREVIDNILLQNPVPATMTVTLEIPATLPPAWVDAGQIRQVFRNLISNGVEAMAEGGTLTISAAENSPDGTVSVSVRDSGSGMAPEVQDRLFQPLFTTKARGIGLGLVVVKNLTEANGGTIEVESAVGRGTTFTVSLPTTSAGKVS